MIVRTPPYLGNFATLHPAVCIPFDSFAEASGAPSATSNFAASDVQIYKDGGTTQRSSSAGITVSTSFDSQTGLQLIVIDLSDNTDAGFYAAGHEYQVAVADVTIDGQTVRFWAATFSIERNVPLPANAIKRASFAADTGLQSIRSSTAQAGGASTITLDSSASSVDSFYNTASVLLTGGTGAGQFNVIASYVGSTKVATVQTAWATAPDSTTTFALFPAAATAADIAAAVRTNLATELGRIDIAVSAGDDATLTQLALIKTQTDKLTFGTGNALASNVARVNDVAVVGNGAGTDWGPA